MRICLALVLCLTLLISTQLYAEPVDDFLDEFNCTKTKDEAFAVVSKYLGTLTSVDDLRELQNIWWSLDKDACNSYFLEKSQRDPESHVYKYLSVRLNPDDQSKIDIAVEMCKKHPDFYWGYRLLAGTAENKLYIDKDYSASAYAEVNRLVAAGLKRYINDPNLKMYMFYRYKYEGSVDQAELELLGIDDFNIISSQTFWVLEFIKKTGKDRLYDHIAEVYIDHYVALGQVKPDDKQSRVNSLKTSYMVANSDWSGVEKIFSAHPSYMYNKSFMRFYEDYLLGTEKYQEMIAYNEQRLDKKLFGYLDTLDENRYKPVLEMPEWQKLVKRASQKWKDNKEFRWRYALNYRVKQPSPMWSYPDADGNMVSMSEQKGKVVVLVLWSYGLYSETYLRSLDTWMKKQNPRKVQIYIVSVLSNNEKASVLDYFKKNNISLPVLFSDTFIYHEFEQPYVDKQLDINGNVKNVKRLPVGYPSLYLIDKKGNIAFKYMGIYNNIDEYLDCWMREI